jgi:hypothetical protein
MTLEEMLGGRKRGTYEVERPIGPVIVHRDELTEAERDLQAQILELLIETRRNQNERAAFCRELELLLASGQPQGGVQ